MTLHKPQNKGTLEIICGPMFSGKSEELIRRLRRTIIARQKVACIKHSLDDRHEIDHVVSHNGTTLAAYPIDSAHKIIPYVEQLQATVVGIDEAQFFSKDLIEVVCELVERGILVILAGLDRDFRSIPFDPMPILLAIADRVTKLTAICTLCGLEATLSQRLVDNRPARFDDPIILIGAQESYQARCRSCFILDKPLKELCCE